MNTRALIIGVVALSGGLTTGAVASEGTPITVAIHVDAHGLNLSDEGDARKFYRRIKYAAWVACTDADRVELAPVDDVQQCADRSLANAIRSVGLPTLTRFFLETHTLQQAAAMGIDVGMVAVAK